MIFIEGGRMAAGLSGFQNLTGLLPNEL